MLAHLKRTKEKTKVIWRIFFQLVGCRCKGGIMQLLVKPFPGPTGKVNYITVICFFFFSLSVFIFFLSSKVVFLIWRWFGGKQARWRKAFWDFTQQFLTLMRPPLCKKKNNQILLILRNFIFAGMLPPQLWQVGSSGIACQKNVPKVPQKRDQRCK